MLPNGGGGYSGEWEYGYQHGRVSCVLGPFCMNIVVVTFVGSCVAHCSCFASGSVDGAITCLLVLPRDRKGLY